MKIEWLSPSVDEGAITIYPTYIVLNKKASDVIHEAFKVAIGVNESNQLIIRPISQDEFESSSIQNQIMYQNITFTPSYARITGKSIVDCVKEKLNLDFSSQQSFKFKAKYNSVNKMIVVYTNKED